MWVRRFGFSLVEVLVALGVFSFAVVGLLAAYNSAMAAASDVRKEAEIRRLLENRVAALEFRQLEPYESKIESGLPGVTLTERIEQEQLVDSEQTIFEFWRVHVVAEWIQGGEPQEMSASFLRADPS